MSYKPSLLNFHLQDPVLEDSVVAAFTRDRYRVSCALRILSARPFVDSRFTGLYVEFVSACACVCAKDRR